MPDMSEVETLRDELRNLMQRVEASPMRTKGGIGGQTLEQTSKASFKSISCWDCETIYNTIDLLTQIIDRNTLADK